MATALYLKIAGDHRTVELPHKGKLIIGRSADRASVVLSGQGVADVHCAIGRLKDGGWALKDLGSEFGTIVNGDPVGATRLNEGDEVLIGSERLSIVSAKELATASEPENACESPPSKDTSLEPSKELSIGGYKIERQLGRGGMGNVVLATQTSLDRKVALKLLKASLAKDATFVERFRTEARAAARLNHPNVVTVFDVGEDSGHHYLSMEFMDGGSVEAQLNATGRVPWREALAILRDAAAGLVYAESRGIVHRDIKPENLMRSSEGPTKIADLGLAVQVEQEAVQAETGKIFGTPHFIAPEVVRGSAADARSDIYSLGATAFRILSGRTPFRGDSTRDILRALLHEQPPRLDQIAPDVPAGVADLVHRMLAKNPDARPPSAAVCVREIDALQASDGAPKERTEGSGGARVPKLLLAGGVLVAVLTILFSLLGGDDADDERDPTSASTDERPPFDGSTRPESNEPGTTGTPPDPVDPPSDVTPGEGEARPAEQGFEDEAREAMLDLAAEQLTSTQRAERLRKLATTYAGTDTAVQAFEEARRIEGDMLERAREDSALESAREATIAAMASAAGLPSAEDEESAESGERADGIEVGRALRALAGVPVPAILESDEALAAERRSLVDRIVERGIAEAQRASLSADGAAGDGDFDGTLEALEGYLAGAGWTDEVRAFAESAGSEKVDELDRLVAGIQTRIAGLGGREEEFAAERLARERVEVGRILGTALADDLRAMTFEGAAARVREAAGFIGDDALRQRTARVAEELEASATAVEALLGGWDSPGWNRRTILLPDGEERVEVVGVAPGALLLEVPGGAPDRTAIGAWSASPRALQNVFFSRLERDWNGVEHRGVVTLLTSAAVLRTLDLVAPALRSNGKTLGASVPDDAMDAFSEAREWARERAENEPELATIVERERRATRMLLDALLAKERGAWSISATLLRRLIDEQRDTLLVMVLSDGGRR